MCTRDFPETRLGPASICISLREPNPNIFKQASRDRTCRTTRIDLIRIFSTHMRSVAHCKLREYHGGRYAAHTIPHLPLNQTSNQILEVVCHAIMHHRTEDTVTTGLHPTSPLFRPISLSFPRPPNATKSSSHYLGS
jgi:hypothetical protein